MAKGRLPLLFGLILTLTIAAACGDDPTPQPTTTPVDITGIAGALQDTIREELAKVQAPLTEAQIRSLVESAVATTVPEGVSPEEIESLVERAVAATAAETVTEEQVAQAIAKAVAEAAAAAPEPLSTSEIGRIVRAAIPATPTAIPTRSPTPRAAGFVSTKVNKLRIAHTPLIVETNRTWTGPWSILLQTDPYLEPVLGNDPETGLPVAGLATSWEVSNGFKDWSFKLRQGVPFHYDWGEFTSTDVAHSFGLLTQEDALNSLKTAWQRATPEIVDDHEITFHFDPPQLEGANLFSRLGGDMTINSKAQWDTEGVEGYDRKPAGTGSYRYLTRSLGESITFERVPDHYSESPEFQELEFVWALESATRVALLLSETVHVSDIELELQPQAEGAGMRVIFARNPSMQVFGYFGGMYLHNNKNNEHYQPGLAWEDVRVRQALNMAIDRDTMNQELYQGKFDNVIRAGFTPANEGWNQEWVAQFDEMYGYNPERARELLVDAGYSDGLNVRGVSVVLGGQPELPVQTEAIASMWADVGVNMTIVDQDVGTWISAQRAWDMHNTFFIIRNAPIRTVQEFTRIFHSTGEGLNHGFTHDEIDKGLDCLIRSADIAERDQCARTMGNWMFDNFVDIPLHVKTIGFTVNPKVVAAWQYPGIGSAQPSHYHLIKATR
jgi:ABC-type transport system substrate-binding protein